MGEGSLFGEATFRQSLEGAGSVLGQAWGRCVSGSGNTQGPWAGSGEARSAGAGKAGEAQGRAGAEGEARQEEGRSWSILQTLFKTVSFILKATGVIRCFFPGELHCLVFVFKKDSSGHRRRPSCAGDREQRVVATVGKGRLWCRAGVATVSGGAGGEAGLWMDPTGVKESRWAELGGGLDVG